MKRDNGTKEDMIKVKRDKKEFIRRINARNSIDPAWELKWWQIFKWENIGFAVGMGVLICAVILSYGYVIFKAIKGLLK